MFSVKQTGLWLAVCLPLSAFAASDTPAYTEKALREECSAYSQKRMRDCLAKKVKSSQEALQQSEDKTASTVEKWDEDVKYINQAKDKLASSNKVFIRYRDYQCEFLAALSGGGAGNAHEIRLLACIAELNNRRAEQLRDVLSELPLK